MVQRKERKQFRSSFCKQIDDVLDTGYDKGRNKRLDSGYTLKIETTILANGLDVVSEKRKC
jgi:hypothetical protein